ncbi:MAG: esterase [Austwickia sp.]|nr:esterase [Austwickia sp.]
MTPPRAAVPVLAPVLAPLAAEPQAGGFWQHPLVLHVLRWQIVGTRAEAVSLTIFGLAVLALLFRRRSGRPADWWRRALLAAALGALGAALLMLVLDDALHQVPGGLPRTGRIWVVLLGVVVGLAVASLIRSRWWRKIIAVLVVAPMLAVAIVGVNASYGIMHSLGELLDKPVAEIVTITDLPRPDAQPTAAVDWLAAAWTPPPGMPATGRRVTLDIPATVSGFKARPGSLYLPPAALVADPPALPVVVLMMGQPGTPDVTYIADALDAKAARHRGLAPIVVVADQTGSPWNDTLCMDTATFGKVETYLNTDVVAWITTHLRVSPDRSDWLVAGYSNGGLCAARFAARYPDRWGNVLNISGEEFPGSDNPSKHLSEFFGGDKAAYDQLRLPTVLAATRFTDTWFVTTVSADDPHHLAGERRVAAAAAASGARSHYLQFATGGHGVETLKQALDKGLDLFYPRLGLDSAVSPRQAEATPPTPIPAP